MPSGPGFNLRAGIPVAVLLTLCAVAAPLSRAQFSYEPLNAAQTLTLRFEQVWALVDRANTGVELDGIEAWVDRTLREQIAFGNVSLQNFSQEKAEVRKWKQTAANLETQIAAEKSRVQIDPEIGALEGAIAEATAAIAGLEGRQQKVVELEAKLKAMADVRFMDAAPREQLQRDLDEARRQLPDPGQIARLRTDLQAFEGQLQNKRASKFTPDASVLQQLDARLKDARREIAYHEGQARQAREAFQRSNGQITAVYVASVYLKDLIAFRRGALAAPTGIDRAHRVCQTNEGPFRCTGAFDAVWSSECVRPTPHRDRGHATVVFTPDGWVDARLESATPGEPPTIYGGRINAAGEVSVNRSFGKDIDRYFAQFRLVTSTLASGASKPIGEGNYEFVSRDASGDVSINCAGTLKLL